MYNVKTLGLMGLVCLFMGVGGVTAHAQLPGDSPVKPNRSPDEVRQKREGQSGPFMLFRARRAAKFPFEFRTINGTLNNLRHTDWGGADTVMLRLTDADYADGTDAPSGANRASARVISNLCVAQGGSMPNSAGLSDMFWQWGQFLDHDLTLAPEMEPPEAMVIPVPQGDPFFDPFNTGTEVIPMLRSLYVRIDTVREQVNALTAYIDGSNLYGSDNERAEALRAMDGTGRLKTSAGNLLPFNEAGLENAPSPDPSFYLAGDSRANEQVALTAMHTLWVREHNLWADIIGRLFRGLDGDTVYQLARTMVIAEMQSITYREFLPLLLGSDAIPPYSGYDSNMNGGISNEFATAAYRFGHSMLSPQLMRLDGDMAVIDEGHLALADAFFQPEELSSVGIEPYLRGLATQHAQEMDNFVIDDVRNFLFGPPGAGGFDLPALNIQRGRDHGLPGYNDVRVGMGLPAVTSFAGITSNVALQSSLASAYASVDDIDLWVGGLSEDHVPGALVGETFHAILSEQFIALRDGDRFWYEAYLPPLLVRIVEAQTLSDIIRRNSGIGKELQENAFLAPQP